MHISCNIYFCIHSLLGLAIRRGHNVVDVRGHKGLDLLVLFLLEQLLDHLQVTGLGILHQCQVGSQALLHCSLGIRADPLEVGAHLHGNTKAQS